jgi:hypothetical protein
MLKKSLPWWYRPVIPALGRLRQENPEFRASFNYIARPSLKKEEIECKINTQDQLGLEFSQKYSWHPSLCL